MLKIIHYRNKCIGCGICYEIEPILWRMSKKDGKATLLNSESKRGISLKLVNESYRFKSENIAKACPVKIIKNI
jgi:ferredoxin